MDRAIIQEEESTQRGDVQYLPQQHLKGMAPVWGRDSPCLSIATGAIFYSVLLPSLAGRS